MGRTSIVPASSPEARGPDGRGRARTAADARMEMVRLRVSRKIRRRTPPGPEGSNGSRQWNCAAKFPKSDRDFPQREADGKGAGAPLSAANLRGGDRPRGGGADARERPGGGPGWPRLHLLGPSRHRQDDGGAHFGQGDELPARTRADANTLRRMRELP